MRFVSLAHYLIARPEPRPKRHFVVELRRRSVKAERRLSFILGIGYATLGTIGVEGRFDYAAIGPADVKRGDRRAGIVLCHCYTGVRSI